MKRILFLAMSVMMALTIKAVNVGDYVYTKVAKYRITGADLVTNGQFTDGSTAGWTATDEANFPLAAVFGPSEEGGVAVQAGQTDLTAGMYQAVKIDMGGTYVVSFKVKGAVAGYTDHDLTGSATNYINAYFNTDGTLGTKDGTTLLYGENGVGGGYQFSYNADDFVEVSFAVEAPQDGNIMIDFRGMAEGLIIKDVECHTAEEVYDDRLAENRIEYIRKFTDNPNLEGKDFYADMKEYITVIEEMILAGDSPEEVLFLMEDLESVWVQFAEANLSNVIELIPTKDGSANTGNNSANWMNWTSKWNKLRNDYRNQAPWSWSTDRWSHKTAAANSPLQIQWQRKVSGDWNNIATLTATLDPGTYYWGVTGQGGMMTFEKNRWVRSWANENAATQLFFNGDTTEVFILNSARNTDYVFKFELAEAKEITLGIICNTNTVATDGFDVQFINPVLYKVLDGGLTPEEKAYLDAVAAQLEALQKCIDVANGYLSEANETLPWGKKNLKEGVDEAQARYAEWAALDEDALLGAYYDDESIPDTIMNNGVRFLNNNYINPFIAMNKPLTDMPGAIVVAKDVLGQRIYSSSAKKADFADLIAASEELYDQMLESEYSEENAAAIIAQKAALEAMAVEFKAAIAATTIVDIDFGTQDAPACFNVIEGVNSYGELETYYTIEGNKGVMTFSDITGSYPYALGWGSATDETTGAVIATDSLGMLRVGNSEAVVNLEGLAVTENTIVNIQFDLYAGNLTKSKVGYKVLSAEDDIICGLFYSPYDGNDEMNTFGINYTSLPKVGASSASNAAIAASSNKTHFDIVLDYGTKTMYCTTISSKGTVTTEAIALPEVAPAKFVLYSNYNNRDRRCWFDNLKVLHISTEEAGDTPNEFDTFPFTITASQTPNADGRYEYTSKVYNVAKPVTSLRFTFKETFCPNGGNPGNPPFVALGEFYLYDENGEQIILSAENFYTNAQEQSEGPIENLCDDDTYTFWHSDWHGNVQEYHYLEVTLPEGLDLTTFSFGWIDRGFNKQNIPLEVEVSSVSITDKLLFETIDNAKALNPYAGTDPGFYDADFTTFYEALAAAEALVGSGASEEELSAALAVLKAELEKVKALQMNLPVAGKSYRIVSAFSAFSEKQDVQKAIYANVDTTFWDFDEYGNEVGGIALWWGNADKDNSYQNFVFEPIENEEGDLLYYVRNVATGLYVNYVGWSFSYLDTIPEPVKLVPLGYGEFNLVSLRYDVEETYAVWHACDHNQGDLGAELDYNSTRGATSKIVEYPGGLNTPSSWYIREMSELPVTVPVSALHFRSDMIHLYSSVNSLTLTADKECAFSDLQVYDLLGNVLPATVFVSGNTATVNLMDKVASFSFSFNSRERVREVIVNGGISQISMLREVYDAAVAVAPIKGDGIMQYANLDEYEAALAHAERLLASNPTDGEIMDAIVLLELAVAHLVPNMPEPGCYYYITSAFDAFVEHQGVNMMMYANEYGEARWDYEDPSDLNRCWEFEPAEYEEGYYLKNAATGMYLGAEYYMSSSLSMVTSKDETVPYVISSLDGDVVAIASSLDAGYKLHAMGHQNGMGSSGAICYWNAGVGTASAWRICKAEDYTLDTLVYAMTAQDVVAQPSSFVNIPIELKNSTAVTAFQFDLYLPEDIATVYDVVLNGYRATDSHRVSYSEQPDGALRVLVYSIEDRPLVGNSGVVADVVVGISSEASEWDYPIVLSNVRMVKTDVTEVLGADYMATLTIVQGALMGDVNSDGQHTMGDVVMIVNALLEKEQYNFNAAVADINGDGQITIVDVVSVVRFVLGYEPVAAARDMHREASMVAIEAGSLMAGNHGEILLPIYIASDADYTAFQMDVVLPEGLTLADATLGGRGKISHTLSWSTLDNGATRIVAFAMDNATFKDNAEALAILTLKAEGALQEGAVINLTDGLFATASGAEDRAEDVALKVEDETTGVGTLLGGIRVSGAEGAVVVESATDAVLSIYTMTGQLVQQAEVKAGKSRIALPAGVYVVNNQKVIVK